MARPATGHVIEPTRERRSYALRFRAYGKRQYIPLGRPEDGWTRKRAEDELAYIMAQVKRGVWQPEPDPEPVHGPQESPTFHEFASQWLARREPELRPKTIASYRWQLSHHLLPFFKSHRLPQRTPQDMDAYKAAKLQEGALGANQVNKTLGLLGRILKTARRYGLLDRDPLEDVDRLKRTKPRRPTMEPEQLPGLLAAATVRLRPIIATMAGAGLRNGEACALNWRDVNIATGTLIVRESKTDAGIRQVEMPAALRDELSDHKARSAAIAPGDPVFPNRDGRRQTVSNVERRLKTAVRGANDRLARLGIESISEDVTPHSLRRLYASLRYALRDDPIYVAEQMGHADGGALSMATYAKAVRRRERLSGAALREFDRALEWAQLVTDGSGGVPEQFPAPDAGGEKTAWTSPKLTSGPDSSVG
jgi:integrase